MPEDTQPAVQTQIPQQMQHRRRKPKSRYGEQLSEKQDLKKMYGIREEQLRKYYNKARKASEETGPALVMILERRLDNAIFRAGLAETRSQARQMASHRLFSVNGRPVNIPSYELKPKDVVTVRESKRGKSYFTSFEKRMQNAQPPSWIAFNVKDYGFTVIDIPSYEEANIGIDIRAIVEYFAR